MYCASRAAPASSAPSPRTSAKSKPDGAISRAISPTSVEGATKTIFGCMRSSPCRTEAGAGYRGMRFASPSACSGEVGTGSPIGTCANHNLGAWPDSEGTGHTPRRSASLARPHSPERSRCLVRENPGWQHRNPSHRRAGGAVLPGVPILSDLEQGALRGEQGVAATDLYRCVRPIEFVHPELPGADAASRSEEHTSELQSRFGISYAV